MRVLTLGTFDTFHTGHVNLLRKCRQVAGEFGAVIVALNTDAFVESFKGHRPVIAYEDRAAVLGACRYVDSVVANDQQKAGDRAVCVRQIRPDAIVVGSDWQRRDYLGQLGLTQNDLDADAIKIVYHPYTEGISSTMIRERVA